MIYIAILLLFVIGYSIYSRFKKEGPEERELRERLDDESIFVEGVGNVKFDDLGADFTETNPDDHILKKLQDSIHDINEEEVAKEFYPIKDLPLNEERRLYLDRAFTYLEQTFGKDLFKRKKVLQPEFSGLPLTVGSLDEVKPLAIHIAKIMDIDPESIELDFFEAGIREFNEKTGDYVYWYREGAAGLYEGKNEEGKFIIRIRDDVHENAEDLIATIAHEFAHIKLLGEERLEENNEDLTDLLPMFYGFGIFMANSCFKFESNHKVRGFSNYGYLRQADWGYLFALYLQARKEEEPEWLGDMNKTVLKYCQRAFAFLQENKA